jgi:hypothetical protein
MPNEEFIRELVVRACREALQQKSQEFAEEVARRTGEALASQPQQPEPSAERTKDMLDGARLIAASKTQPETLETLLAAVSAITPACGLMVLRGAQAIGWGCYGLALATTESFKRTTMDCTQGVAATVIGSCSAMAAQVSELDPGFAAGLSLGSSAQVLLVPVLLKERVAALLIALSPQTDDMARVELLAQVAQLNLDLQAYRKAAPAPRPAVTPPPAVAEPPKPAAVPPAPAPVYAEPAATRTMPVAPPAPEPVYAETAPTRIMRAPVFPPAAPVAPPVAAPAFHQTVTVPQGAAPQAPPPVLDEAHDKARRFAKLLVEEIKLYNQTKLAEGRARGDLYSRLREDIEKSRGAYQKRYGEIVKDTDYFSQELLRILAENNRAVMGPGFPG